MTDWTARFFWRAAEIASWSKHPTTKVGCVAVDSMKTEVAFGFYGLPRGMQDDHRITDRDFRHNAGVHAEANLIAAAARKGVSLAGCSIYVTAPPCSQCAGLLIQSGISSVYWIGTLTDAWNASVDVAHQILGECGIPVRCCNDTPWAKAIRSTLEICAKEGKTLSTVLSGL